MFKNPFSFSGRIRRLEYGLSYLSFIFCFYIGAFIMVGVEEDTASLLYVFILIIQYWFFLAQGTKRCHDLGNSGFFQLIPFYGLWMLFEDGNPGPNKYGYNPKEIPKSDVEKVKVRFKVKLPKGRTRLLVLNEIMAMVLLNVLIVAIGFELFTNSIILLLILIVSVIPCYFLALVVTHKAKALPNLKPYFFRHRLVYVIMLFVFLRIYLIAFQAFGKSQIVADLIGIFILIAATYIPYSIYKLIFKAPGNDQA